MVVFFVFWCWEFWEERNLNGKIGFRPLLQSRVIQTKNPGWFIFVVVGHQCGWWNSSSRMGWHNKTAVFYLLLLLLLLVVGCCWLLLVVVGCCWLLLLLLLLLWSSSSSSSSSLLLKCPGVLPKKHGYRCRCLSINRGWWVDQADQFVGQRCVVSLAD